MEQFKKAMEESGLKQTTIKNYVARLRFIEKSFGEKIDEIDFADADGVISHLEKTNEAIESKRAYVTAIIKYLRVVKDDDVVDKYAAYHKKMSAEVKSVNMKNEMKSKEAANYVPFEEMKQKYIDWFDANKDKEDFSWSDALFLGNFLLLKAPVRLGNWRNMVVVYINKNNLREKLASLKNDTNYLIVVNNKLMFEFIYVFNDYKTSAYIGEINVVVDDVRLIEMLMKVALLLNDGDYINNMEQSVQSNKIKRMTKKIFEREQTIDTIRHSYVTDLYDNKRISATKRKELLTLFGHSYNPSTTDLYYKMTEK
jgi:hypothetical protein